MLSSYGARFSSVKLHKI
uniref:Uncharacterized protein n=1 Tax=Arundo donax TaxID=35708 RepID=A0A0A9AT32_ARUDO